ncbi:hypothetical protein OG196_42975 (plasmid) [Kitasatospora purpeofusca]|uniref:hypothetical protein n=1 Tax=Kitasatospora purpeofusca TaxID=67352 RepID=UPI002E1161C9|nr:hypothetical protein OG196_42975 [Kitasatospora purpeofusca]
MSGTRDAIERRLRRLEQLRKSHAVVQANAAVRDVWERGSQPPWIKLRAHLLYAREEGTQPPLTQLVNPRGIALRFYLLAVFEAQCRLATGAPWTSTLGLTTGRPSWADMVAIDGPYNASGGGYLPATKQGRNLQNARLRQLQGALRTLEDLGTQRSLVTVPRSANGGRRLYADFALMSEEGRGNLQTPHTYTVPGLTGWDGNRSTTVTVPADFFLNGWVQILNPSEVATWLVLRELSQHAPTVHTEQGVYLYGNRREEDFGLKRDAWQDSCHTLRAFGLIRYFLPGFPEGLSPDSFLMASGRGDTIVQRRRERYEPHRYQVTDQGLEQDALTKCIKEITFLRAQAPAGKAAPAEA